MTGLSPILSRFARPHHAAAAEMVLSTLTLGDKQSFAGLSLVLRAKLTRAERKGLAWAALRARDNKEVVALAEAVVPPESHAGPPLPAFEDVVEDAAWWAGIASEDELKAYLFACFLALPERDKARFLAFAKRRVAA